MMARQVQRVGVKRGTKYLAIGAGVAVRAAADRESDKGANAAPAEPPEPPSDVTGKPVRPMEARRRIVSGTVKPESEPDEA